MTDSKLKTATIDRPLEPRDDHHDEMVAHLEGLLLFSTSDETDEAGAVVTCEFFGLEPTMERVLRILFSYYGAEGELQKAMLGMALAQRGES